MRKLTLLLSVMIVLITVGSSKLSADNPLKSAKIAKAAFHNPKAVTAKKQFDNFSLTLTRGNISGVWVIELSGPTGTYQYPFNSGTITIPSGIYQVGIHAAGGTSSNYTIAGSVCTYNFYTYGSSAYYNYVPCTCGSGSFSIN